MGCTLAAAFVEIGGLEDSPLHEETKAGEGLSQSHHHHRVVVGQETK